MMANATTTGGKRPAIGFMAVLICALTGAAIFASAALASPLSWSTPQQIDPEPPAEPRALTSVSCSTPSFCAATDHSGNVLTSTDPTGGPSAWHKSDINGERTLFSVSCPSSSFCAAIGVTELGGGGAFTSTDPGGSGEWDTAGGVWGDEAISCPSSSFCAASGFGEISTTTDPTSGEAWKETTVGGFMPDISCSSPSFCAAGDWNQNVYTSTEPSAGSATWHGADLETGSLNAISCPSRSFCAVGNTSNGVWVSTDPTGNAEAWQPGGFIESLEVASISGVSCPTASFCVAVNENGSLLESTDPTGGAEAWTVVAADPSHSFTGVSCPTASFCVAVDNEGNVLTGAGEPIPQHTLTASKTGEGSGTIVSSPASGIECGSTCSHAFDDGTPVTLTATPAEGSTFAGWSGGGCSGTGACEVTISTDQTVSAEFVPSSSAQQKLRLTLNGSGLGEVIVSPSPPEYPCVKVAGFPSVICSYEFDKGTHATLTATPAAESTFTGWTGGGCTGTGTCELSMTSDMEVTGTFAADEKGDGSGGGGGSPAPTPTPSPSPEPKPNPIPHKKSLKCKKGFEKRKVRGKTKCVKIRRGAHK